jgi:nucleosome binding factor SPN SPT16 subunit
MFTVRLSLANFDRENRPTRNCLQIADTILVTKDGAEVLTKGNSKEFNDISYTIDEDEEVEERGESAAVRRSNNPGGSKPRKEKRPTDRLERDRDN